MTTAELTFTLSGRVVRHCSNRLFEWMTALMMVGIAVTIAASPRAIAGGGFTLMENVGLTPGVVVIAFLLAGAARMAALYANGHWPFYGPWCRAIGAVTGAVIWAQMGLSMLVSSVTGDFVPLGVPVYLVLTAGEIISCYRAASDGRSR